MGQVFRVGGEGIRVSGSRGSSASWGDEVLGDVDGIKERDGRGLAGTVWNSLSTLCMNIPLTRI